MKSLILYYSFGGNTKRIANMIQKEICSDIAEIKTIVPYEGDYNDIVSQGQDEVESGYEPELKPLSVDLSQYDKVILGTPVWWYTFAPAVRTLLCHTDWTGKTIYPFATNGGWLGHTLKDIEKACAGAKVMDGLDVKFEGNHLNVAEYKIKKWIDNINK